MEGGDLQGRVTKGHGVAAGFSWNTLWGALGHWIRHSVTLTLPYGDSVWRDPRRAKLPSSGPGPPIGVGWRHLLEGVSPPLSDSQPQARPVKPSQPQLPGQILGQFVSLGVVCYSKSLEHGHIIGDRCITVHTACCFSPGSPLSCCTLPFGQALCRHKNRSHGGFPVPGVSEIRVFLLDFSNSVSPMFLADARELLELQKAKAGAGLGC